ncbi:MAG: P1 family peptidase [Candidatus Promineifilaceae bacterium]|nr:P1 family peptidase [Candidatus Promineifilaceae bacterium]
MTTRYLDFDFPAVKIGAATYEDDPTGCTVFVFPERVAAAVDVRGGDPGVSEYQYSHYDAICFAGGSLRGLEAAHGVRAELVAQHGPDRDLVSGAVVNDGYKRANGRYPDKALGQLAYRRAEPNRFPLGARGAGRNVWVGGRRGRGVGRPEQAGQGGAFGQFGLVKVAAFTVLNAFGALHDRQGRVVRGNLVPESDRRTSDLDGLPAVLDGRAAPPPSQGNTTLTLVVTNQALTPGALRQVGRQVHAAMARAIQPFHTIYDGDVLYTVTTNQVEDSPLDPVSLGLVAAEVVWDALLTSSD